MSKRISITLTDEQYKVLSETATVCSSDMAQLAAGALDNYMIDLCERVWDSTRWPRGRVKHGGKRKGAGRPPKNGG